MRWALILLAVAGCISIPTHERALVAVQRQDIDEFEKWSVQLSSGEISTEDLLMLVRGRRAVVEMKELRWGEH